MSLDELVPEFIRRLPGYTPGKPIRQAETESGVSCIKMASNENPWGPSPRALEAMRAAAADSNFYPDNDATTLRHVVAERHRLPVDQVLITAGSSAFLDLIARVLLRPGLNAVSSERSFIVYPIATKAAGARFVEVPMREHTVDLDALLAAIDPDTRLVFLANPNNPTGTMFDAAATDRFLEQVPGHVLVILDEAYCDFAEDFSRRRGIRYSHSLDYVREGRNVVVLRTFSKAHGLAGMRVGYGFGPASLLSYCANLRPPFSISGVAEAAALAAFEDGAHVRKTIENNAAGAVWLLERLRELGLTALPTSTNFIYFDVGEDCVPVVKRMQEEGVIVRPLRAWGAPTAIRVTVGTPEQNERFIAALKKSLRAVVGSR